MEGVHVEFAMTEAERVAVAKQLQAVDATTLSRLRDLVRAGAATTTSADITPFPHSVALAAAPAADRAAWRDRGLDLIFSGKVAALLLAGGQGSRLGYEHPKGMYNLGLPSGKSLFRLQAERIMRVQQLASEKHGGKKCGDVWWLVMTSDATHRETVEYFEHEQYFGLDPAHVRFFEQGMLPALDKHGNVLLETRNRVALSPNGNAGLYQALVHSGILSVLEQSGVELMYQYGVDNALVPVCDPTFIGFVAAHNAECACTCVEKTRPEEPVGVLCMRDGKPAVAEYTEISAEARAMRDPKTNRLVYSAAHICVNAFSVAFLRKHALSPLPFHVAHKVVPCATGADGVTTRPAQPNAYKAEMFIFDIFQYAERMCAMLVPREDCFAPLKNPSGSTSDNPETCRAAVFALHKRWLTNAGAVIDESNSQVCEVSPLVSFEGEGLQERFRGARIALPAHIDTKTA